MANQKDDEKTLQQMSNEIASKYYGNIKLIPVNLLALQKASEEKPK